MSKSLSILVGVFALLSVPSFGFAQEWAGTYVTTISEADVPPEMKAAVGKWDLILGDEGEYTSSQNGEVVVRGNYSGSGDQMTFSDSDGTMACAKDQAVGVYKAALDGGTLSFTLVEDDCAGRRIVLTSHALTKQPSTN